MLSKEQRELLNSNEYDKEKYYTELLKDQLTNLLGIQSWAETKRQQFAGIDATSETYGYIDFKFDEYKGDFAFIELNSYNNPVNNGFAGKSTKLTNFVVWVKLETGNVYVVPISKIKEIANRCNKVGFRGRTATAKGRNGGSNGILWNLKKLADAQLKINVDSDDVVCLKNKPFDAHLDENDLLQKEMIHFL